MEFRRYYGQLARRQPIFTPHADEAKRDYADAMWRSIDAALYSR